MTKERQSTMNPEDPSSARSSRPGEEAREGVTRQPAGTLPSNFQPISQQQQQYYYPSPQGGQQRAFLVDQLAARQHALREAAMSRSYALPGSTMFQSPPSLPLPQQQQQQQQAFQLPVASLISHSSGSLIFPHDDSRVLEAIRRGLPLQDALRLREYSHVYGSAQQVMFPPFATTLPPGSGRVATMPLSQPLALGGNSGAGMFPPPARLDFTASRGPLRASSDESRLRSHLRRPRPTLEPNWKKQKTSDTGSATLPSKQRKGVGRGFPLPRLSQNLKTPEPSLAESASPTRPALETFHTLWDRLGRSGMRDELFRRQISQGGSLLDAAVSGTPSAIRKIRPDDTTRE